MRHPSCRFAEPGPRFLQVTSKLDPGSAAHRFAKSYALRCVRGTTTSGIPMTHPSVHARTQPNKIAYQMAGTGKAITYRELDELSNQGAQLFRSLGLKAGDHIALLMENRLAFMEICGAAQRAGLYHTAISRYLTQDEIAYIVN